MSPLFDDQKLRKAAEDIAQLKKTLDLTPKNADRFPEMQRFLDSVSKLRLTDVLRDQTSSDTLFFQYIGRLERTLDQEPDEHEVFEHPNTELFLPENQGRIITSSPSLRLIEHLREQRISLHDLTWREFEGVVAELLRQDGYTVQLGRGTKDDGKDIIAFKDDPACGFVMSVWQAKKLNVGNKVGIKVIRELADTRIQSGASKGVIVTSTSLTKGALDRIERDRYLLHKKDGDDLLAWIRESKRQV